MLPIRPTSKIATGVYKLVKNSLCKGKKMIVYTRQATNDEKDKSITNT